MTKSEEKGKEDRDKGPVGCHTYTGLRAVRDDLRPVGEAKVSHNTPCRHCWPLECGPWHDASVNLAKWRRESVLKSIEKVELGKIAKRVRQWGDNAKSATEKL